MVVVVVGHLDLKKGKNGKKTKKEMFCFSVWGSNEMHAC